MYSLKNSLRMCFVKQALEFKETYLDNCCFFLPPSAPGKDRTRLKGLAAPGKDRTRLKGLAAHFGRPGNVLVTSY
jgi:hypothetical protein